MKSETVHQEEKGSPSKLVISGPLEGAVLLRARLKSLGHRKDRWGIILPGEVSCHLDKSAVYQVVITKAGTLY